MCKSSTCNFSESLDILIKKAKHRKSKVIMEKENKEKSLLFFIKLQERCHSLMMPTKKGEGWRHKILNSFADGCGWFSGRELRMVSDP